MSLRFVLNALVFLLPASSGKNRLLRLLGHDIHPSASIAPVVVVGPTHFTVGKDSRIGFFNTFRNLRTVTMGSGCYIGQWNWLTCAPEFYGPEGNGTFTMGSEVHIVSRHIFDCAGGIRIGDLSTIAGYRSLFMSHGMDFRNIRVLAEPIRIGEYCLVNAANNFVMGSVLPDRSVTAMGAVVRPGLTETDRLYGGVPAKAIQELEDVAYFSRTVGRVEVEVDHPLR